MDLLQGNNKNEGKTEKTQAQKVILILLIISIILCVIVGLIMLYVSTQDQVKQYSVAVNGAKVDLNDLQMMSDDKGKKYVGIKALTNKLGYNYYNGEYKVAEEGKNKGYVNTKKNIVQFFADSKEIYKTTEDSKADYEYYVLDNTILEYEGNIYIALDDLPLALNVILHRRNYYYLLLNKCLLKYMKQFLFQFLIPLIHIFYHCKLQLIVVCFRLILE